MGTVGTYHKKTVSTNFFKSSKIKIKTNLPVDTVPRLDEPSLIYTWSKKNEIGAKILNLILKIKKNPDPHQIKNVSGSVPFFSILQSKPVTQICKVLASI